MTADASYAADLKFGAVTHRVPAADGMTDEDLVAAGRALLDAEPVHRLTWTCPSGCAKSIAVCRHVDQLEQGAVQLARTIARHRC